MRGQDRAWLETLFGVASRMMLFRPARGGLVSRKKLEARVRQFQEGEWISLLRESVACAEAAHSSSVAAVQMRSVRATRGPLSGADGRALCSPTGVGRGIICTR